MCEFSLFKRLAASVSVVALLIAMPVSASGVKSTFLSQPEELRTLPSVMNQIRKVSIKEPDWLVKKKAEEAAARRIVTYDIATRGAVFADLSEFKSQVQQTLNDSRGWRKLGISFQEVSSGGLFTVVLSEAGQVPSFSSGCDSDYSCRAGRYVIINQDRWLGATPSWNSAGGSIRDYRHMVINHETGHWLGHGHQYCTGSGEPASVMQQQSISLQGCVFNPWPLSGELWSSR